MECLVSLEIGDITISVADERGEVIEEGEECYIVAVCAHNGLSPIVGIWHRKNGDTKTDKLIGRFYPDELIKAAKIVELAGDE